MRIPGVQGDVQDLPFVARLVTALQGRPVSNKAPTTGQSLVWNGTQWAPKNVPSGNVSFVGARIEAHATQSITTATNTDVTYDTVRFDTSSMANLGADARILTVPTTGLYLVICETGWAYNGTGRRINAVLHNQYYSGNPLPSVDNAADTRSAIWTNLSGPNQGRSGNTSVGIFQATAGDYFSSGCYQTSGGTLNANGFENSFLAVVLLGAT